MPTSAHTHDPLETLVIAQIAALKQREHAIHSQFEAGRNSQTTTVFSQLQALQERADRLSRMLDAMDGVVSGTWQLVSSGHAAA